MDGQQAKSKHWHWVYIDRVTDIAFYRKQKIIISDDLGVDLVGVMPLQVAVRYCKMHNGLNRDDAEDL